jgi:hypothetical protein
VVGLCALFVAAWTTDKLSAAKVATAMYEKEADRYRDALKWAVGAAAILPAALVGTAPFSGLADVIRREGSWSAPVVGFGVTVGAMLLIILTVAWILRPIAPSLPGLAQSGRGVFWWRWALQRQYADNAVNYLDGRARDLQDFKNHRGAWLGTIADIERYLETEAGEGHSSELRSYLAAAKARVAEDADTVGATLERGTLANMRGKARTAQTAIGALFIVAVIGFIAYLGGLLPPGPPVIESITTLPAEPQLGDRVTLQVVATGTGFTYEWKHDGNSVPSATGPKLIIPSFGEGDAGTYQVVVTDKENRHAFSDPVSLRLPQDSSSTPSVALAGQ